MIFIQKTPGFKEKYKTKFIIYELSVALIYVIIPFLGFNNLLSNNAMNCFIFYQVSSLFLGILQVYLYKNYFNRFEKSEVWFVYFFTLITVTYSFFSFAITHTFLNGPDLLYLMATHFILFFIPQLIYDTFNLGMIIPAKVYRTWQFPVNYIEIAGVSDSEMKDLVVITFLIKRDNGDEKYKQYRAKGPTRLDFGRLFYNFVLDYNTKHEQEPIAIQDKKGLYSWVFFFQTKWYESARYIDPTRTLYMNAITENAVIVCMRTDEIILDADEKKDETHDVAYQYDRDQDDKRIGGKDKKEADQLETIS
ncbi:hypothetical protein EH230_09945 [Flavobacterium columnare]|nr:hypothetical protein BWK59_04520 [Flavobacterium davisii]RVU91685.1 hypothetical protein EH230_09945 [Flavobacterium columnare]